MQSRATLEELRRRGTSGPAIDRASTEDADRVLRELFPDPAARAVVVELLVRAVRRAHSLAPRSWSFTLFPRAVRLNVGRMLTLELLADHLWTTGLDSTPGVATLEPWSVESLPWKVPLPPHHFLFVPARELPRLAGVLGPVVDHVVDAATKTAGNSSYRQAWSPGVVGALELAVGGELPRPDWITELPVRCWWQCAPAGAAAPSAVRAGDGVLETRDSALMAAIVVDSTGGSVRVTGRRPIQGTLPVREGWHRLTAADVRALGLRPVAMPGEGFLPGEIELLRKDLEQPTRDLQLVQRQRAAFNRRFGPDVLASLQGPDLLERLHGRASRDSLVYWLEFKDDDVFRARNFGSIAGGSAYKFGMFQRAEDQAWVTGNPRSPTILSPSEAAAQAERQRDEILAAWAVVDALPDDPQDPIWRELPADMAAAAPTLHHLAFLHKILAMWAPDKVDDYHSPTYQAHLLGCLGFALTDVTLYHAAPVFVRLHQALRTSLPDLDMDQIGTALNARYGAPHGHWRIGTHTGGADVWPDMRDREFAGIGWDELGNLDDLLSGVKGREAREALKDRLAEVWSDNSPQLNGRSAAQIQMFYEKIQEGDLVYAAKGQQILGVGRVIGPYRFDGETLQFPHRRTVRWLTTTPFTAPSGAGLQTTVYDLADATDIQAAARWHFSESVDRNARIGAIQVLPPAARALGPIEVQLLRKGQVILYGPPGTGKTFHALQAAQAIVAHEVYGRAWASLTQDEKRALEKDPETRRIWMCTFHPAFGYEDFVEGLKPHLEDGQLTFRSRPGIFRSICERAAARPEHTFVLIVDEFNRGDAPRIFGELLTLLELDKRDKVPVVLPTSGDQFTIPSNVRLIATMNTADRSIALLDAALRRRFGFLEFLPDHAVLAGTAPDGLPLDVLLTVLNERLLQTLGDSARNLQIGHSYLMKVGNVHTLRGAFQYDILPLLQEYCSDDPEQLERLLGKTLYDRAGRRVRPELFASGQEERFLDALTALDPARLERLDTPSKDEPELDA